MMDTTYLVVENNDTVHKKESEFLTSYGISFARVSSMDEAIKEASKNQYTYIGIHADNINYMPMLRVLRGATDAPILISTSCYTTQEQSEAMNNGADLFWHINENSNDNYASVTTTINMVNEYLSLRSKL